MQRHCSVVLFEGCLSRVSHRPLGDDLGVMSVSATILPLQSKESPAEGLILVRRSFCVLACGLWLSAAAAQTQPEFPNKGVIYGTVVDQSLFGLPAKFQESFGSSRDEGILIIEDRRDHLA
jgi:hypothetical protein